MPKKFFSIYPRTKEAQMFGIQTENGDVNFGGKTVFNTSDAGLVEAIKNNHKGDAYAVHDEQLSKAYDSGSWDIVKSSKGSVVKFLHNYTFTMSKPKKLSFLDKVKRLITKYGLSNYLWFWDTINPKGKRERGVRILGVEFTL